MTTTRAKAPAPPATPRAQTILAGFEVGTGADVRIPLAHTCITGQTQLAGKTTTLEALITRSDLRAVAFRTKRGERAFLGAREHPPYFRDAGDWQFVSSILEASRGERLKFERSWIIKAARGATTLADVHRNVKRELEAARGLSESVYTVLDAYLEIVVPQISRMRFARRVELAPGVNVVDLEAQPVEMQALVIRSFLEWVHEREERVVTIIPEAWEFIPQNRGSPVKLSVERLIRKGAGLHNFVWPDSQDLGALHKDIVRSCGVMLFGVQREANEVKRNLANIPAGLKKPPASDIQTLGIGEFYVCHGRQTIKTYIWPAWMSERDARAIARGEQTIEDVGARPPAARRVAARVIEHDEPRRTAPAEPQQPDEEDFEMAKEDVDAMRTDLRDMRKGIESMAHGIESLVKTLGAAAPVAAAKPRKRSAERDDANGTDHAPSEVEDRPARLTLETTAPELVVDVERRELKTTETDPRGRVATLIADGFFDEPENGNSAYKHWKARGFTSSSARIYEAIASLVKDGFLVEVANGKYQRHPRLNVQKNGTKTTTLTINYK